MVFASPNHGEVFDRRGNHLAGPAVGDLNRVEVAAEYGRLTTGGVAVGAPRAASTTFVISVIPWDAGPSSGIAVKYSD